MLLRALYDDEKGVDHDRLSWLWEAIQSFLDDKTTLLMTKEDEGNTQRLLSALATMVSKL